METELTPIEFSSLLKDFRAKAKWTQKELSEKIGVSLLSVLKWEHRRTFPKNADTLKKLAQILQLPVHQFLKIKAIRRSEHRKNLILRSKDPVVSSPWLNYVPLLDRHTRSLSLEEIKNPSKWGHRHYFLPTDLYPGFIFAFEITDPSAEPVCRKGDVVFADIREPVKEGRPVIIKVKGHPPLCRLYSCQGETVVLKAINSAIPAVRVKSSSIEWRYTVIRHMNQRAS